MSLSPDTQYDAQLQSHSDYAYVDNNVVAPSGKQAIYDSVLPATGLQGELDGVRIPVNPGDKFTIIQYIKTPDTPYPNLDPNGGGHVGADFCINCTVKGKQYSSAIAYDHVGGTAAGTPGLGDYVTGRLLFGNDWTAVRVDVTIPTDTYNAVFGDNGVEATDQPCQISSLAVWLGVLNNNQPAHAWFDPITQVFVNAQSIFTPANPSPVINAVPEVTIVNSSYGNITVYPQALTTGYFPGAPIQATFNTVPPDPANWVFNHWILTTAASPNTPIVNNQNPWTTTINGYVTLSAAYTQNTNPAPNPTPTQTGCFIATAAGMTPTELTTLRAIRDLVKQFPDGKALVDFYYANAFQYVPLVEGNPELKQDIHNALELIIKAVSDNPIIRKVLKI